MEDLAKEEFDFSIEQFKDIFNQLNSGQVNQNLGIINQDTSKTMISLATESLDQRHIAFKAGVVKLGIENSKISQRTTFQDHNPEHFD
jgi:uncharacterized protein YdiU (UPF0061 family)